jgi:hypothetical protein
MFARTRRFEAHQALKLGRFPRLQDVLGIYDSPKYARNGILYG